MDDLFSALAAFLAQTFANELPGGLYDTYAPQVAVAYAVLTDQGENYDFQIVRDDFDPTRGVPEGIADGVFTVTVYATSDTEARRLTRAIAKAVIQAEMAGDGVYANTAGRTMEMRPANSAPVPITTTGPGTPTMFARALAVHYKENFSTLT